MENNIMINDYSYNMGQLIDVQDKKEYLLHPTPGSTNIPFNELIFNHTKYLDKNKTYYLVCLNGHKSKRATNILRVYGYKVINVLK